MGNLVLSRKSRLMAALATTAVSLGIAAGPAAAQQNGLVNVDIHNVLNNNNNNNNIALTIPVNAAANICGVSVNMLAQQLQNGPVSCDSRANQDVTVSQRQ